MGYDNGLKAEFAELLKQYTKDLAVDGSEPETLLDALAEKLDQRAADFWYTSTC